MVFLVGQDFIRVGDLLARNEEVMTKLVSQVPVGFFHKINSAL